MDSTSLLRDRFGIGLFLSFLVPIPVALLIGFSLATLAFPKPPPDLMGTDPEKVGEGARLAAKSAKTVVPLTTQGGLAWQGVLANPKNAPPKLSKLFEYISTWLPDLLGSLVGGVSEFKEGYQPAQSAQVSGLSRIGIMAASLGLALIDSWFTKLGWGIFGLNGIVPVAVRFVFALVAGYALISQLAHRDRTSVEHIGQFPRPSLGWLSDNDGAIITPLCVEWTHKEGPTVAGAARIAAIISLALGVPAVTLGFTVPGLILIVAGAGALFVAFRPTSTEDTGVSINGADPNSVDTSKWEDGYLPAYDEDDEDEDEDEDEDDEDEDEDSRWKQLLTVEGHLGLPDELGIAVAAGVVTGAATGALATLLRFPPSVGIGVFLLFGAIAWRVSWGGMHPAYVQWSEAVARERQIAGFFESAYPGSAPPTQATPVEQICEDPPIFTAIFQASGSTTLSLQRLIGAAPSYDLAPGDAAETFCISELTARDRMGNADSTRGSSFAIRITWSPDPMSESWLDPEAPRAAQLLGLDHLFQTQSSALPERPMLTRPPTSDPNVRDLFSTTFPTDTTVPAWQRKLGEFRQTLNVDWAGFESTTPGQVTMWWSRKHPSHHIDPDMPRHARAADAVRRIDFANGFYDQKLRNEHQETPKYVRGWRDGDSGVISGIFDLNGVPAEKVTDAANAVASSMSLNFGRVVPPPREKGEPISKSRILFQTGLKDPLKEKYGYDEWWDKVMTTLNDEQEKVPEWQPRLLWSPGVSTEQKVMPVTFGGQIPHWLLSGATGSGKTVLLKSLFLQLAYQNSPSVLQFMLMDGAIEAAAFAELPHTQALLTQGTSVALENDEVLAVDASRVLVGAVGSEHKRRMKIYDNHPSNRIANIGDARDVAHAEVVMAENGETPSYWDTKEMGAFPNWDTDGPHPLAHPTWIVLAEEIPSLMESPKNDKEGRLIAEGFMDKLSQLSTVTRKTGILFVVTAQRPTAEVVARQYKQNALTSSLLVSDNTAADYVGERMLSKVANPSIGPGEGVVVGDDGVPQWMKGYFAESEELVQRTIDIANMWGGLTGRDQKWWKAEDYVSPEVKATLSGGNDPVFQDSADDLLSQVTGVAAW